MQTAGRRISAPLRQTAARCVSERWKRDDRSTPGQPPDRYPELWNAGEVTPAPAVNRYRPRCLSFRETSVRETYIFDARKVWEWISVASIDVIAVKTRRKSVHIRASFLFVHLFDDETRGPRFRVGHGERRAPRDGDERAHAERPRMRLEDEIAAASVQCSRCRGPVAVVSAPTRCGSARSLDKRQLPLLLVLFRRIECQRMPSPMLF